MRFLKFPESQEFRAKFNEKKILHESLMDSRYYYLSLQVITFSLALHTQINFMSNFFHVVKMHIQCVEKRLDIYVRNIDFFGLQLVKWC